MNQLATASLTFLIRKPQALKLGLVLFQLGYLNFFTPSKGPKNHRLKIVRVSGPRGSPGWTGTPRRPTICGQPFYRFSHCGTIYGPSARRLAPVFVAKFGQVTDLSRDQSMKFSVRPAPSKGKPTFLKHIIFSRKKHWTQN